MANDGTERSWIQTYTGKKFYPFKPDPTSIDINDIAHALSNLCRYTGHCRNFYSVAEHCVRVSERVQEISPDQIDCRWGLLHDASEAYLNDIARPVKYHPDMALYRLAEQNLTGAIAERFCLIGDEPALVKLADTELLFTERRDLLSPSHPDWEKTVKVVCKPLDHVKIDGWNPKVAEVKFLERFYNLFPGW